VEDQESYAEFLKMDPKDYPSSSGANKASPPLTPATSPPPSPTPVPVVPMQIQQDRVLKFSPAARHLIQSRNIDPKKIIGI
jgi:pyruvate/2-oxoglutarate dehydrogenase complex dihydrolipoamide acyltransferase (E2) component